MLVVKIDIYSNIQTLKPFIVDIYAQLLQEAVKNKQSLDNGLIQLNGQTELCLKMETILQFHVNGQLL